MKGDFACIAQAESKFPPPAGLGELRKAKFPIIDLCKVKASLLYTNHFVSIISDAIMKPFLPEELPIKKVHWERLIPLISKANRSIAQYEGVLYGVPNPEVLLSPLTTQEAVLSSKIEGTQATLGEVLKFEAGEKPEGEARRQDIQEIINYRRALTTAEEELKTRPFNLNLLRTRSF